MYNCEKQIPRVIEKIASLGEDESLFSGVLVVGDAEVSVAVVWGVDIGCGCDKELCRNDFSYLISIRNPYLPTSVFLVK